ncbi:hypothetical protein [Robiginitalea sp. SC105]|uniref:hypothetical protein n=1 Tax=Robiginitalea sp. SC105 TaxID=2762332 RepID=UPI00163B4F54|nr:hypothetical protein [Robiginitalea sp. SC105]MBC2839084.1 hypothetical protein [Robiginitalea sp. SC105]
MRKDHSKYLFPVLFFISLTLPALGTSQGCVAIRHFSSCSGAHPESNVLAAGSVLLGTNYRYFKSFRHFRGTEEEPDRVANQTEVINHSHAWDFFLTYGITDRWYASVVVPTVINTRSSLYEHGREERNTTFSRGLADIRWNVGYWLLDPAALPKGNIAVALGMKLPTGNYQATDIFYNVGVDGSPEVRPVDQSIQPGDGGFGITAEFQFYRELSPSYFLYGGGFYLFNPRETNGVRTFRETLSPILQNEAIMSVPDQFSLRLGLSHPFSPEFTGSIGARFDGVPVEDVIGGSGGFRRPGNVLAIDPGISYTKGPLALNLSVPFAVRRERPQSLTDLETEQATGNPRNGDAAFADYVINVGVIYRLGGNSVALDPEKQDPFNR